jgi:hypothetical protein
MDALTFFALSLAVWRISYMLTTEAGPMDIFVKLRALHMGGLFDCIYCTSVYAGFLALLFWLWGVHLLLYPFALSGCALMLRAYTGTGIHDVSAS